MNKRHTPQTNKVFGPGLFGERARLCRLLERQRDELREALGPFANYACPHIEGHVCKCNNCIAARALKNTESRKPTPFPTSEEAKVILAEEGIDTTELKSWASGKLAEIKAKQASEQMHFEYWLSKYDISGDAESVKRQWRESSDYADFIASK